VKGEHDLLVLGREAQNDGIFGFLETELSDFGILLLLGDKLLGPQAGERPEHVFDPALFGQRFHRAVQEPFGLFFLGPPGDVFGLELN
jgi:hypothetical protein